MRVQCEVDYTALAGDYSNEIDSVMATCSRCDHTTEAYGTGDASVRRCLMALREECPRKERNFYVGDLE